MLEIIYPAACPFCGEVQTYGGGLACPVCLEGLSPVKGPVCFKCGKEIGDEEKEYCKDCVAIPKSYVRGYPVWNYTGAIKDALYDFKYNNRRDIATIFSDGIYSKYSSQLKALGLSGIIPIPVYERKRRKRGYNQSELIARGLSRRLKIPMYTTHLARCTNTNPQKELNDQERMKNLKNAFITRSNDIKLDKILLVDDIYTSGATIEACTRVLMAAGVKEVYYTSVAIGQGYVE